MLKEFFYSVFNFIKFLFFFISIFLIGSYFKILYDERTCDIRLRNLTDHDLLWLGIWAAVLIFMDVLIAISFFRYLKNRKRKY
jgi:hypothetical protein